MGTTKSGCRTCRHMMPTGRPCQSPAMRESAYCYFHAHLHGPTHRMTQPRIPLDPPPLDSPKAVRDSVGIISNLLIARKINPSQAGRILYGIQTAAANLGGQPMPPHPSSKT